MKTSKTQSGFAASFGILAAVAIAVVVIPRYQNAQLCEGRPALPGLFAD
jgi:hypothetical protein